MIISNTGFDNLLYADSIYNITQVKNVKIDISKSQNGITTIWLNNIHFKNFLKELWNTLQKTLDNGNQLTQPC